MAYQTYFLYIYVTLTLRGVRDAAARGITLREAVVITTAIFEHVKL